MRIVSVPCLKDNFAYLVIDDDGRCAVVDPGEAAPVEAALTRERVELAAVWATHHHPDHVGGIGELVAGRTGAEVVTGGKGAPRGAGPRREGRPLPPPIASAASAGSSRGARASRS